jgi:2-phosphosulfolactate phosphatase
MIRHVGARAGAQRRWDIWCEWGPSALAALGAASDVVVIVDVLSFSTCVDIAVSGGAEVFPYLWRDERAAGFAAEIGGVLAGPRGRPGLSLSPASFLGVAPGTRVVLPSPNGATLSHGAGAGRVLTACLRNAGAVARAAARSGQRILVVPAGERWPDGSLRPCIEDWIGAGAVIHGLGGRLSPEAEAARHAFRACAGDLPRVLGDCTSGQELVERGFAADVALAAELDVSDAVPDLRDRAYRRLDPSTACGLAR